MPFVTCYAMSWLMYHSRGLHRSPLSLMRALPLFLLVSPHASLTTL